jgi:uncharacterized membrane protein YedE/YeeE
MAGRCCSEEREDVEFGEEADRNSMNHFTPVASLVGGLLIGTASSALLIFNGRLAGITGICAGLVGGEPEERDWRAWFLGGLLLGGLAVAYVSPSSFQSSLFRTGPTLAAAGLLVGLGARLANGCTSGHGLCGLSRGSLRSMAAVSTFMLTGALTVFAVSRLFGGRL